MVGELMQHQLDTTEQRLDLLADSYSIHSLTNVNARSACIPTVLSMSIMKTVLNDITTTRCEIDICYWNFEKSKVNICYIENVLAMEGPMSSS